MTRRSAVLFAGLGVAWGIPYLLIAVAVTELAPSVLVLARTALGAVLLLPLALARGQVRPVLRRWRPLLAYTAAEVLVPWLALARAERTLPSSTTALVIAAVPLLGLLVAALARRARLEGAAPPAPLGRRGGLGLAMGTLGVAALVGVSVAAPAAGSGAGTAGALAELGLVVVGYAVGAWVLGARLGDLPGTGVVAVSLALSALVYLPVVLLGPGLPAALPSAPVVASVVVLAVVCTALAFLLLVALVAELGAVRATTVVYVNPLVAVAAGALVLGEAVTAWTVVGALLVLGGSVLASSRTARPHRTRSTVESCSIEA